MTSEAKFHSLLFYLCKISYGRTMVIQGVQTLDFTAYLNIAANTKIRLANKNIY